MLAVLAIDLAALLVVAVHIFAGARQGLLRSLLGFVGLLLSTAAAYGLGAPLARLLVRAGWSPTVALAAAGMVVFLLVMTGFALAARIIRRRRSRGEAPRRLSTAGRIGGAVVGLVVGAAFAVAFLWVAELAFSTAGGGVAEALRRAPSARAARTAVETAARGVFGRWMEEAQAETAAAMLASPARAIEAAEGLFQEPGVLAVINSPAFQADFLSGDPARIASNRPFRAMLSDAGVIERLTGLGLVATPGPEPLSAEALAPRLAAIGRRVGPALDDPEVEAMIEELRAEGRFDDQNVPRLLMDHRIRFLLERFLSTGLDADPRQSDSEEKHDG